jgi:hypothetical protein
MDLTRKEALEAANTTQIVTGSDPELFFTDKGGQLIPAFHVLPMDKKQDFYADGFQAEFKADVFDCHQRFVRALGKKAREGLAQVRLKFPDAQWSPASTIQVPAAVLAKASDKEVELGCDPSLNVYGQSGEAVAEPRKLEYRFAGGHIHFGLNPNIHTEPDKITGMVKMLDATVGLAVTSMAAGFDNPIRRRFYGLAGEFRMPPHGIEYRTLSNFWTLDPHLAMLVQGIARRGARLGLMGYRDAMSASDDDVQAAINQTDHELARRLIRANARFFQKVLAAEFVYFDPPRRAAVLACYHKVSQSLLWTERQFQVMYVKPCAWAIKHTWQAILEGPDSVGLDVRTPEANWTAMANRYPAWSAWARSKSNVYDGGL